MSFSKKGSTPFSILNGVSEPMSIIRFKTIFQTMAIGLIPIVVASRDDSRTGITIINRTAGAVVSLGHNAEIVSLSSNTIRLLTNEGLALKKVDGEATNQEYYAISTVATVIEIISSYGV